MSDFPMKPDERGRGQQPSYIAVARYNDYQRRKGFTRATIDSRRHRLASFSIYLAKQRPPVHILDATPDLVVAWLDSNTEITDFTRGIYISCLSAFYMWALREDLIVTNPIVKVDRPKPIVRLPRPAPDEQLAIALEHARTDDKRMAAWICLGAYQGFRCIEMARLQVSDVDRHNMTIRAMGKGNRERVVPLHKDTFVALLRYGIPPSGFMFSKRDGTPLAPATVSLYGGRFFHELGFDITMHQLRHWFGTRINATSDLLTAKELMGHASTATTEIYTRVNVERFAPVVSGLAI